MYAIRSYYAVGGGTAGHGRTLIVGRFFSVRHFSAILPLLQDLTCHFADRACCIQPDPMPLAIAVLVIPPFRLSLNRRKFLPLSLLQRRENPCKISAFRRILLRIFRNTFYLYRRRSPDVNRITSYNVCYTKLLRFLKRRYFFLSS